MQDSAPAKVEANSCPELVYRPSPESVTLGEIAAFVEREKADLKN